MDWRIILAMAIALPIILLPATLMWYLNISGIYQVIKDKRRKAARVESRCS